MKNFILSLFLQSASVFGESQEEINQQVFLNSKRFWVEQFQVFEEKGFTREMILGAKDIYFHKDFTDKMHMARMQLWTIVDGKVYLEQGPHVVHNASSVA